MPPNSLDLDRLPMLIRTWGAELGFEQIGALSPDFPMQMRFYACRPGSHHDIALIQMTNPEAAPPVKPFDLTAQGSINAINHYAVAYTRENFLKQLEYMKASGVKFVIRGEHGMTHSCYVEDPDGNGIEILYELPAEVWEQDVNGALNYFVPTATEGEACDTTASTCRWRTRVRSATRTTTPATCSCAS